MPGTFIILLRKMVLRERRTIHSPVCRVIQLGDQLLPQGTVTVCRSLLVFADVFVNL